RAATDRRPRESEDEATPERHPGWHLRAHLDPGEPGRPAELLRAPRARSQPSDRKGRRRTPRHDDLAEEGRPLGEVSSPDSWRGNMDRLYIFDTTLRDGEQSPGASLTSDEKLEIALQLSALGVDIIEAGFPIASPDDAAAVRRIASEVKGSVIAGLARCKPDDIDVAWDALRDGESVRLHTFISTSDIHLKHQFRMTREEALEHAVAMVKRAKSYVSDVEFSPMDATRSDWEYLYRVLEAVIKAGATTIN